MEVIALILPAFAVMLTGYVFARLNLLPESVETELIRFLFYVAVPAIMFGTIAEQNLQGLLNWPFIMAFGSATAIVFVFALTGSLIYQKGNLGAATMSSMTPVVANTAIIGLPLLHSLFGKPGVVLASLANILIVVLLLIEVVLLEAVETKSQSGPWSRLQAMRNAVLNPIVLSTLLGVAYAVSPLPMPVMAGSYFDTLGAAVAPCALFAVGMSLRPASLLESGGPVFILAGLKLIVLPCIALALVELLNINSLVAVAVVLCAALPTAKNQFILSQRYRQAEQLTTNMVSLTTVASVATLLLWLLLLARLYPSAFSAN
ncbi:MAG: AEC family transporter [Pseudomonadota bacterium]